MTKVSALLMASLVCCSRSTSLQSGTDGDDGGTQNSNVTNAPLMVHAWGQAESTVSQASRQAEIIYSLSWAGLLHPEPAVVVYSGGDADVDVLLRKLQWQHGTTVWSCQPCTTSELYAILLKPRHGLKILIGDDEGFQHLNSVRAKHWIAGRVVLLPVAGLNCTAPFRLQLFDKASLPLCLEMQPSGEDGSDVTVYQRSYDGSVRSGTSDDIQPGDSTFLATDNFHGRHFQIYYMNFKPYFECGAPDGPGSICTMPKQGPDFLIWTTVAARLNMNVTFRRSPDDLWGHMEDNGEWVGNVGAVYHGEADAAISGLFVTGDRASVSQFSSNMYVEEVAIVSGRVSLGWDISLLKLLSPGVWGAAFGTLFVIAICGVMLVRPWSSFLEAFVPQLELAYRQLWGQSSLWQPTGNPHRTIHAVWAVASIVLGTALGAALAAQLASPRVFWSPMTLWDVANEGYQVITHAEYGAYQAAMRGPQNELFDRLRSLWVTGNNKLTMKRMLDSSNKVCLFEEVQYYKTLVHQLIIESEGEIDPENIRLGSQRVFFFLVAYSLQKNTPHKSQIDSLIERIKAFGLVQHAFQQMRQEDERKVLGYRMRARQQPRVVALSLSRLATMFEMLLAGWIAAALALVAEIVYKRASTKKLRRKPEKHASHLSNHAKQYGMVED